MPNWVSNQLNVYGDEEKLAIIKREIANDATKEVIDFNKVIPMPEHSETFYADGNLGEAELQKYGKNNWYDWSIVNWGTKWNCCKTECVCTPTGLFYNFETAWDAVFPIAEAISKKYGVRVELTYFDEEIGCNCGEIEFDATGAITKHNHFEENGYDFVALHYGDEYLEENGFVKENGEWVFRCND